MDARDARVRAFLALAACAALAGGAAAAPTVGQRVAQVDRQAAQRFLALAVAEKGAKHGALAQRALRRVVDLDPENSTARRELGFRRGSTGWTLAKEPEVAEPSDLDEEKARALRFRADERGIEEWRAREIVKVCAETGPPADARPHLLALLDRLPRMAEVHVALGHEKVGDRYVRPALVPLARRAAELEASWAAVRTFRVAVEKGDDRFELGKGSWPVWRVGKRVVHAAYPEADARDAAAVTGRAQRLLDLLLGEGRAVWDPSPVYFLPPREYETLIRSRAVDAPAAERMLRSASNPLKEGHALRAYPRRAEDAYAHNAGYHTAKAATRGATAPGEAGLETRHAWWLEGLGYFLSLELSDSAISSFFSRVESMAKERGIPPPAERDRGSFLAWIQALALEGEDHPLREVVTRSLNSLDLHASIEAWSFVRFLALLDPVAFRKLPAALREQTSGGDADRADEALRQTYARGVDELGRLWRAWLLEVA